MFRFSGTNTEEFKTYYYKNFREGVENRKRHLNRDLLDEFRKLSNDLRGLCNFLIETLRKHEVFLQRLDERIF